MDAQRAGRRRLHRRRGARAVSRTRPMGRARAWLEIMRISNAPTVVSNGIAGAVLGALAVDPAARLQLLDLRWLAILSPLACYIGGMVLNDAFDATIDARERPSRPIPSGRISRSAAFVAGVSLLAAGVGIAAFTGPALAAVGAGTLAVLVVAYNAVHTLTAASVVLLALCRALAAFVPMAVFARDAGAIASGVLIHPALLAGWTLLLSVLARGEVKPDASAFQPCPACGHLIASDSSRCTECGKVPNPAIAETNALRSRLLPLVLLTVAVLAMPLLCMKFLPRAAIQFENFSSTPAYGVPLAIGLAIALAAASIRLHCGRMEMPRYIGLLIAALAGIDAIALASIRDPHAFACIVCFVATLMLQRRIAGS